MRNRVLNPFKITVVFKKKKNLSQNMHVMLFFTDKPKIIF